MRTGKFLAIAIPTVMAAALAFSTANAGVYRFTLSGSGLSASGEFITSGTTSPYDVIDVTGTASDESYVSDTGPSEIIGVTGFLGADNLLYYPAAINFADGSGIAFYTANGDQYWAGAGYGTSFGILYDADYPGPTPAGLSVAEVPEASTWVLMALGFATFGLFGGRKRNAADPRGRASHLRPNSRSMSASLSST